MSGVRRVMRASGRRGISSLAAIVMVAVILGAAGLGGWYALRLTGAFEDSVTAADRFFDHLREGRVYDAYRECAAVVRTRSFESFERSVEALRIDEAAGVDWQPGAGGAGGTERTIEGTLRSGEGNEIPVTLRLTREAGTWKVFELRSEAVEGIAGTDAEDIGASGFNRQDVLPSDAQLRALVLDTLLKFNEAVQIRYFGPFHQTISTLWQRQTTPDDLQSAFQAFIDNRVNIGGIAKVEPVFSTTPQVTSDGLLTVEGDYPTPDYIVGFRLKFVYERGKWRLFAINVDLKSPTGGGSLPPTSEGAAPESAPAAEG